MGVPIYVKIPNYKEVKYNFLEIKKVVYLELHDTLKLLQRKREKIELLRKALICLGEIKEELSRLRNSMPPEEEIKKIEEEFYKIVGIKNEYNLPLLRKDQHEGQDNIDIYKDIKKSLESELEKNIKIDNISKLDDKTQYKLESNIIKENPKEESNISDELSKIEEELKKIEEELAKLI